MRRFGVIAVGLYLAMSFCMPAFAADPGQPIVDTFTGTLNYGIPIETSPGRQSIQPNLSLSYRSANENGLLGVGWELEVGSIERSTRFGVSYAADDYVYRQDGSAQELVSSGSEYRAKIESGFVRIRKLSATDGKPCWEVTNKMGVRFFFGQTAASRQDDSADSTRIFKWCLDRVEDTNGNYMILVYTKDQGQIYLDHIDYTGNASLATTNTIKLYLETRPDLLDTFTPGFRIKTASRLKTIQVTANGQTVRAYKLVYTPSNNAGASSLTAVHNYGSDANIDASGTIQSGTDLKILSATYEPTLGTQKFLSPTSWQDYLNTNGYGQYYGDYNGDGKTDMMVAINDASSWRGYYASSNGDGTFATPASWTLSGSFVGYKQSVADISSDGKSDLLLAINDSTSWRGYTSLANGDGTFSSPVSWTVNGDFTTYAQYSGDVNGNGSSDLILAINDASSWRGSVLLANGDGTFASAVSWSLPGNFAGYKEFVGDVNGDGKTDQLLAINDGASWRGYVALSNGDGTFASPVSWTLSGNYSGYTQSLSDENGDGKIDLILTANDVSSWRGHTAFSTGDGTFTAPVTWTLSGSYSGYIQSFGDFNGDGKTDILLSYGDSSSWRGFVAYAKGDGTFISPMSWTHAGSVSGHTQAVGDFTGDGKADMIIALNDTSSWRGFLSPSATGNDKLLVSMANAIGGSTTVTYKPSTQYTNIQLPFPLLTVSALTVNDGNGTTSSTSYLYSGGYFHIGERDFRGFNYAKATGPLGPNGEQTISEIWYHQGNDRAVDANTPDVAHGYMKGKPYRSRISDGQGTISSETTTLYADDADGTAPWFNPPQVIDAKLYSADSTYRQMQTTYAYDSYGNITTENQYGDINDSTDDKTVVRTYYPNTTAWILSLPATEVVYKGVTSEKVTEIINYYDGTTSCSATSTNQTPTKGNLARSFKGLANATGPLIESRMGYDAYGNITCLRDAHGKNTLFTYDASKTFVKSYTNQTISLPTTYEYYGVDGVAADKGLYGQLKSTTDSNGNSTIQEYDIFGRPTRVVDPYGTVSPYGTISYFYQDYGTVGPQMVTTIATAQSSPTCSAEYTYNSLSGKCEAAPTCSAGNYNSSTKQCEYAATVTITGGVVFDKAIRIDPNQVTGYLAIDHIWNSTWAIYGYVPSSAFIDSKAIRIDPNQVTGYLAIDHIWNSTWAIYGYVASSAFIDSKAIRIDPNKVAGYLAIDHIWNSTWAIYGYVASSPGTYLRTTTYSCPAGGNVTGSTCQISPSCSNGGIFNSATNLCEIGNYIWKEEYFDGLGRIFKTRTQGPENKAIVSEVDYDARGAVTKKSLPYFEGTETPRWLNFTYDSLGRTLQAVNPDSMRSLACYDNGVTVTIDPNNHRKRQTTDVFGRLVKVEEYLGTYETCSTDAGTPYATTTYQYDLMGNLRFLTDALGNQTEMRYDGIGRKVFMHDPDMGDWTYAYDGNSNLVSQTDANLKTINFTYDALNRLIKKDYPTGTDSVFYYDQTTSTYGKGRLTTVTDASGTTKYFYDKLGRPVKTDRTIGSATYTLQFAYDALSRVTSITYPDNDTVDYFYDLGGNLAKVGTYATYASFNALGQPGTISFGNGVATAYQYSALTNRLQNQSTRKDVLTLLDLSYTFDNVGNITAVTNSLDQARSQTYAYDELNRLVQAQNSGYGTLAYSYNQIGNILAKEGVTFNYGTKPHAVATTSNGKTYTYDANGNMYSDGTRTITYDYDNMPKTINGSGVTFTYNAFGERVKKATSTNTTTYIDKFYEYYGPNWFAKNIYAGNDLVAVKMSSATYYYHPDHLGSTSIVTDGSGNKVEDITYYPFGGTNSDTGTTNQKQKYTGQEWDWESGLYNYNARLYDPTLGRFVSADTVVPDPTDPQSLNRYSYARNNPLYYTDPTGHWWEWIVYAIVVAAIDYGVKEYNDDDHGSSGVGLGVSSDGQLSAYAWNTNSGTNPTNSMNAQSMYNRGESGFWYGGGDTAYGYISLNGYSSGLYNVAVPNGTPGNEGANRNYNSSKKHNNIPTSPADCHMGNRNGLNFNPPKSPVELSFELTFLFLNESNDLKGVGLEHWQHNILFPPLSAGFGPSISIDKPTSKENYFSPFIGLKNLSIGTNVIIDNSGYRIQGLTVNLGPSVGIPFGVVFPK